MISLPQQGIQQVTKSKWMWMNGARVLSSPFSSKYPLLSTQQQQQQQQQQQNTPSESFQKTLNLPKTKFPMRSSLAIEKSLTEKCSTQLYQWQESQNERPLFVLHDGPPFANGKLHIGHALNKILKDIIVRYKLLKGYRIKCSIF